MRQGELQEQCETDDDGHHTGFIGPAAADDRFPIPGRTRRFRFGFNRRRGKGRRRDGERRRLNVWRRRRTYGWRGRRKRDNRWPGGNLPLERANLLRVLARLGIQPDVQFIDLLSE